LGGRTPRNFGAEFAKKRVREKKRGRVLPDPGEKAAGSTSPFLHWRVLLFADLKQSLAMHACTTEPRNLSG
jgi:hypothetical protein